MADELRKFFTNTITITVLSEDGPVPSDMDVADVIRECTLGGWSMTSSLTSKEVTPAQVAAMLLGQGSDSELFGLDADGNDLEGT